MLEAVDALCEEFFRSLEPRQECEAVGSVPARQLVPRMRDADGSTSNMEVLNGNAARTIKPSLVDEVFGADTDVESGQGTTVLQVEEVEVDAEELRVIDLAMQSAAPARRLCKTQVRVSVKTYTRGTVHGLHIPPYACAQMHARFHVLSCDICALDLNIRVPSPIPHRVH